jgi:hypothetical protein
VYNATVAQSLYATPHSRAKRKARGYSRLKTIRTVILLLAGRLDFRTKDYEFQQSYRGTIDGRVSLDLGHGVETKAISLKDLAEQFAEHPRVGILGKYSVPGELPTFASSTPWSSVAFNGL